MYIDYSTWETFEYKTTSLKLDLDNPRIRYRGSDMNQTQVIEYLLETEKVYELAKKISEEGYFVNEAPIICIENNKKVVLEGNRRVSALKILKDPEKYLSKSRANTLLNNISKNNFPVDKKIKCHIAPNRLLANPIIYERHQGSSLKRWETGNQYAFVAEMYYKDGLSIDDICDVLSEKKPKIIKPLKAYNLFFEGKEVLEKEENIIIDIMDFDITNLERFYSYENARKSLGIEFNPENGELLIKIAKKEFEKRLLIIFKLLINAERFSRDFNRDEDKERFVNDLKKMPEFESSKVKENSSVNNFKSKTSEKRINLDEAKKQVTFRRRKTKISKSQDTLFDRTLVLKAGKVNDMYSAIAKIYRMNKNDENILQIVGMSLRLLIEIAARIYLEDEDVVNKDKIYDQFLKKAKNEMEIKQDQINFLSLTTGWINSKNNLEAILGKFAHGNIITSKSDILTSSYIIADILEFYFKKQ